MSGCIRYPVSKEEKYVTCFKNIFAMKSKSCVASCIVSFWFRTLTYKIPVKETENAFPCNKLVRWRGAHNVDSTIRSKGHTPVSIT